MILSEPEASSNIKLIIIGKSGSGKTGALASLAKDYKLHILDMDNNWKILRTVVPQDCQENVEIETHTDQYRVQGTYAFPATANAWSSALTTTQKWVDKYNERGHIIAVDSLTNLSRAAMRFILNMNNRLQSLSPWDTDYGQAQNLVEAYLSMLTSKSIKCDIIVISHVKRIGGKTGHERSKGDGSYDGDEPIEDVEGVPQTIGRALSPAVPTFFPNMLISKDVAGQRYLFTVPQGIISAKTEVPGSVLPQYPVATGLAAFFKAIRSKEPERKAA